MAAVDAVVLEEVAPRRKRVTLSATTSSGCDARLDDKVRGADANYAMPCAPFARRSRHQGVDAELGARTDQPPSAGARPHQPAALDGDDDYIDAAVKEAMRLRPVAPFTFRLAAKDFEMPGLTIPAGTMVVPFITLVHRRADL